MSSVRKRGGRWQAQVRRTGFHAISRTFAKKSDALRWANEKEARLSTSYPSTNLSAPQGDTIRALLERYQAEITPKKRGHAVETIRIEALLRQPFSDMKTRDAAPSVFASFRDKRLTQVAPETVRKELQILSHLFSVAVREWNCPIPDNPIGHIERPSPSAPRTRRLEPGEYSKLELAARHPRMAPYLWPLVNVAIETAMRRGELLSLRWTDICIERRIAELSDTKSGDPRSVPLSREALSWLDRSPFRVKERPFETTGNAVRLAWSRLTKRAGIEDLHFHDLRHEAISRLFEKGLSVAEVALISGHRDVRQLFRYTHLRAEDIAKKLR